MKRKVLSTYVGAKIKEFRMESGIKQAELGMLLNLSRVSILNMETGRHMVGINHLFFLAGLFKKEINDFFPPVDAVNIKFEEKQIKVSKKIRKIKVIR